MIKLENMLNYSQPDFYKFSRDGIELAHLAANCEMDRERLQVLELFAGSGVISIEFSQRHSSVDHITFVELQADFKECLEENTKNLTCDSSIVLSDFRTFSSKQGFDIILLNPPYFDPSKSRLGPDKKRNTCRFTLDFSFEDIINSLEQLLCSDGAAYICHSDSIDKQDARFVRIGSYQSVGLFRFTLNIEGA